LPTANLLLDRLFGAEIIHVKERQERDRILEQTFERAANEGLQPYLVPYGGSSPTGALGYAFAMDEFMKHNVAADWIVFATSSGGTQAGLVLGQRLFGYKGQILGISVDESDGWIKEHVSALATAASQRVGDAIPFKPNEVLCNADYCQAGYGVLSDKEREAIRLFAQHEGLLLDPVYTGRAGAGLIDLIRKGFFNKSETVLFWHTGGQPALFAERYAGRMY
jgi:1-aminocyclopropane-1-carboxylate deaminase/D-cysteine desulfhydrase-like pyridoxal-dependent ACC family enzyme